MTRFDFAFAMTLLALAGGSAWPAVAQQHLGGTAAGSTLAREALPIPSAPARELFLRHKERLAQVRVILNAAGEQSSLGSAFVVRDDGPDGAWLVTNYHVVSALAINPQKYRLELRRTSELTVPATLVAIDVIHDLAILRVGSASAPQRWPSFTLRASPANQGERVYALGHPLELGFLISEGLYNGRVEQRLYEQMLFSGALNSGMSGGPAIDANGHVVGVNVATHRMGQLISFLVPVTFARDLLASAVAAESSKSPARKEWRSEISRQLVRHQQSIVEALLRGNEAGTAGATPSAVRKVVGASPGGFTSQTLSGRQVQTLDGTLTKCWAGARDSDQPRYQRDSLQCSMRADVFINGNLQTGSMRVEHTLLRNLRLATPQFLAIDETARFVDSMNRFANRELARADCNDEYVKGQVHVYRVSACLRSYKRFDGIYDFSIRATQVDDANERLVSALHLRGFSFANARSVSRQFLDRLQ